MSLRIPEFHRVPGLVYGAHWSEPGVSGYYVGVAVGELVRVAQSPAADACPCCEAHDRQVGEGPGFVAGCEECEEAVRVAVREVAGEQEEEEEHVHEANPALERGPFYCRDGVKTQWVDVCDCGAEYWPGAGRWSSATT